MQKKGSPTVLRFGPFEVNPETHELRKHGVKLRINGQAFKILACLLEEPGRPVTRDELRRKLWPEGTFVDFDHSLNAAVNRLRERLGDSAERSCYIETLPGLGYRFIAFVELVSLPESAMILNSYKPQEREHCQIPPRPNAWKRSLYALTAIMLLIAALIVALIWQKGAVTYSVALLPLQNISHDPEQDYLVDGITDQLITELGRFRELQVISRTSTEQYRHSAKSLAEIARELKVKYVVEGAIARSTNRIRINVGLVQTDSGRQLWSESYEDNLNDELVLQRNVARAVAQAINKKLTKATVADAHKYEQIIPAPAFEAYLKGKYIQAKGTQEAIYRSIAYFEQAIKVAPDYASARAALAQSYCALSTSYAAPRDVMPKARSAAEEALRIDDTSAEAHSLMGRVAALYDWNWAAAEKHLQRAVELNPSSALARVNRATFLCARGRVLEAVSETRKAHELDPASLQNEVDLELNLFDANQLDLLGEQAKQALQFDPEFPFGHTFLGWTLGHKGMLAGGMAHAARGARDGGSPVQIAILGALKVMAGEREAAMGLLRHLQDQRTRHYVCAHEVASLEAALGMKESALRSLENAYQERSDCMPFLHCDPLMNPLRSDPRFQALLQRIEK